MVGREIVFERPSPKASECKNIIRHVARADADALLLSGGVDSSALAWGNPKIPCYTTSLESTQLDLKFAGKVAKQLNLDWRPVVVNVADSLYNLKELLIIEQKYDLAILNDLALFIAIKRAIEEAGASAIRSGEIADMLFRGYYETYVSEDTAGQLDKLPIRPLLPLDSIEQKLRLSIDYPYLNESVRRFARKLKKSDNIAIIDEPGAYLDKPPGIGTTDEPKYILGKIMLRQAMMKELPDEIVTRVKTEIQYGSGMNSLRAILRQKVKPGQREDVEAKEHMHFRSDEHFAVYIMALEVGFKRKPVEKGEYPCTWCGCGVEIGNKHCSMCGAWPANRDPKAGSYPDYE